VFRASSCKDLDIVVSNTVNLFGSRFGERIWEGLDKGHLSCAGERPFIVVVTEYGCERNFSFDEELGVFEDSLDYVSNANVKEKESYTLSIGSSLSIDLISTQYHHVWILFIQ
jgi:hypothetical protein